MRKTRGVLKVQYEQTGFEESTPIWMKIVFILAACLFSMRSVAFSPITAGLDPSWIYVVNYAGEMGLKFGRDIYFTFGPLGFLYAPMYSGFNLIGVILFECLTYIIFLYLLYTRLFRMEVEVKPSSLLLSLALMVLGMSLSRDNWLIYLIMLAISVAWHKQKNIIPLGIAAALTVLVAFIKFSAAIAAILSLILFFIFSWIEDRKTWKKSALILVSTIVSFCICYLIYNPSFTDLLRYCKSAMEISSHYSSAMSLNSNNGILLYAIFIGASYFFFALTAMIKNRKLGFFLFLFAGAMFTAFKHGFVRADDHVFIFFSCFAAYLSIVPLFFSFAKKENIGILMENVNLQKTTALLQRLCAYALILLMVAYPQILPKNSWLSLDEVRSYVRLIRNENTKQLIGEQPLPNKVHETIGTSSVTIYPFNLSYDAYNDINFRPMPILQAYSVYSPYLDELNASFFKEANRPRYILFNLDSIDGRWPLIECPLTWKAIYENYKVCLMDGSMLLLQTIEEDWNTKLHQISEGKYAKDDTVSLPGTPPNNTIYMEIEASPSLLGRLANLFFRVQPIGLEVIYTDGTAETRRMLPEVLVNPTLISKIPTTLFSASMLINNVSSETSHGKSIESIRFVDDSTISYYSNEIKVSFYTYDEQKPNQGIGGILGDVNHKPQPYEEVLLEKEHKEHDLQAYVDFVNRLPPQDAIQVSSPALLEFTGWCFDDVMQTAQEDIYLSVDGEYVYQGLRTGRNDVADHFAHDYIQCGFTFYVYWEDLKPGEHELSIIAVGDSYYVESSLPHKLLVIPDE